jgi:hypothetical protein
MHSASEETHERETPSTLKCRSSANSNELQSERLVKKNVKIEKKRTGESGRSEKRRGSESGRCIEMTAGSAGVTRGRETAPGTGIGIGIGIGLGIGIEIGIGAVVETVGIEAEVRGACNAATAETGVGIGRGRERGREKEMTTGKTGTVGAHAATGPKTRGKIA